MNQLIKRAKSSCLRYFILLFVGFFLISCQSDEMEIRQNFPFEVKMMPIPSQITNNQTVEMRLSIVTEGEYSETKYHIRYFQFEGKGTLQYGQEEPYLPNDLYPLKSKDFRLYYTSKSAESHQFSIWISDNFGNERQIDLEFEHQE